MGDLFEWRQAEDCWVRYRLTGVSAASGDTREFAIKSYSHTYTGCSGAIGGSGGVDAQSGRSTSGTATTSQFTWAPVTLQTGAFTAPTWHGPWLVVPENWTGPVPATALFTGPSISWPPSPLPAPNLGTGWSGSLGRGYPDTELEGWYSHTDGGFLDVYIFQLGRWPIAVYRLSTTYAAAGRIHEFRVIDGRYAHLSYDRLRSGTSQATVVIYDDATGLVYTVRGGPKSRNNDPEATIDLARKFILPPAGPPPTTFRYDRYDTSGEVAEPGSYAFLADPADTGSAVTIYEALRDGSATALRIHETDADGVSRAAFLDAVEVGDLFEWREAEDCWVRYRVIGVSAASGDTRKLAIKSYSYTYTGCSGAVGGSATARQFTWAPETLKTGAFTVPTMHGPWLIVPTGWTGTAPDPSDPSSYTAITPPAITWPPDPLPDPDLGPGWMRGGVHMGYGELEGLYSHTDGGTLSVYMFQPKRRPLGIYRTGAPYDQAQRINEFPIIDGRPAHVAYDRVRDNTSAAQVVIYDETTGVLYNVRGGPISRKNDPEATIEIAKKFILPPAGPPPTSFRYDTYDTTGEAAKPGSYAFLEDPADTTTAVTTYEDLRDGTATALRIHETDADGVSRAAFLDTVEVGDLFEWRQAEDCFVRYKVTAVKPDPAGTVPRKSLGVESIAYAFTGCSGAIATGSASGSAANSVSSSTASVTWGALPNLGGTSLTVPIVQGPFQLVPAGWTGATKPVGQRFPADPTTPEAETTSLAEARTLPHWREPELPEGWQFTYAESGDESESGYFRAYYDGLRLIVSAAGVNAKYWKKAASGTYAGGSQTSVRETLQIAGRPAQVHRSITERQFRVTVHVWDDATGVLYMLRGSPDMATLIAFAESMFE